MTAPGAQRLWADARVVRHAALGALATLGGFVLYLVFPLVFPTGHSGHRPPMAYMIPVYPFFGFAVAELWSRRPTAAALAQLAALAVLAFARMLATIPASGHIMMMVWFVLAVRTVEPPRLRRAELALGVLALVGFLVVKLVFWRDYVSPALGAVLGVAIYGAGWAVERRGGAGLRSPQA